MRRLRRKDRKQVQLERKEKGFSIYLNGANNELPAPAPSHIRPRVKTATGLSSVSSVFVQKKSLVVPYAYKAVAVTLACPVRVKTPAGLCGVSSMFVPKKSLVISYAFSYSKSRWPC